MHSKRIGSKNCILHVISLFSNRQEKYDFILPKSFLHHFQPGIVAGLIPWLILKNQEQFVFEAPFSIVQYFSITLFAVGVVILILCVARLASEGRGTLSPLDPTKKLVISGLYKYSRNPMYVGFMLILTGEILFFQSLYLLCMH